MVFKCQNMKNYVRQIGVRLKSKQPLTLTTMKRLYILVNKKLSPIYGCVQAGHAVAQWLLENPSQTWNNEYLIYLYADTDRWLNKLKGMGAKFSAFREPDLNYTVTAIAVQENSGELFKDLETVK